MGLNFRVRLGPFVYTAPLTGGRRAPAPPPAAQPRVVPNEMIPDHQRTGPVSWKGIVIALLIIGAFYGFFIVLGHLMDS